MTGSLRISLFLLAHRRCFSLIWTSVTEGYSLSNLINKNIFFAHSSEETEVQNSVFVIWCKLFCFCQESKMVRQGQRKPEGLEFPLLRNWSPLALTSQYSTVMNKILTNRPWRFIQAIEDLLPFSYTSVL